MPYSLTISPSPLEAGQGFLVDLHISAPDAVVGDQYQLVPVPTPPTGILVIDTHTAEIRFLEADGSAKLMFGSMNGFQVAGHYELSVCKTSDPLVMLADKEFDVVLPAPLPGTGTIPGAGATGGGGGTPPIIVDPDAIAVAVATAIASRTPTPPPTTPPAQPSAWQFMSTGLSWITAVVVVLAVLVIGMGILGMPAWAVWLISKNGSSQNGQSPPAKVEYNLPPGTLDMVKGLIGSGKGSQTINPICTNNCSATGNLFNPGSAQSKP